MSYDVLAMGSGLAYLSLGSSSGVSSPYDDETSGSNVPQTLWKKPGMHRVRIAALALAVFTLDTVTKVDIIIPILYVIVVMYSMRSGRRRDVVATGWGAIALTIISFLITFNPGLIFASPTRELWIALLNNGLSFMAIIIVTILSLNNIDSQTEILRARGRIARVSSGMSLRALSASVVHEISQPLTAIRANAEAAFRWVSQSPPNVDETKTACQRVVAEVERTSHIIGSLRRLLTPGDISLEACDALRLIQKAVAYLDIEIDEAGIDLSITCPSNLKMIADGVLVEQVIVNSIANSIDSLHLVDKARRKIDVEAISRLDFVQITIKDTGIGSDEAVLGNIFHPFFSTKKGNRMGIGLAISKSIIDAHGGRIRAYPAAPHGLAIEIEIPAAMPA